MDRPSIDYPFEHEATKATPYIKLDAAKGEIVIKGMSFPENAKRFYYPVMRWVEEYSLVQTEHTIINIGLDYVNSGSVLTIVKLMKAFDFKIGAFGKVTIKWYYEENDNEIKQMGIDFQKMLSSPIELIKVRNIDQIS